MPENTADILQTLLESQKTAQLLRGYYFDTMSPAERLLYIQKHALYLTVELGEFLVELPGFKDWKKYPPQMPFSNAAAQEELVDVMHFFLNICLAMGLTASDIQALYMSKNATNNARLQDTDKYKKDNISSVQGGK